VWFHQRVQLNTRSKAEMRQYSVTDTVNMLMGMKTFEELFSLSGTETSKFPYLN
jgi:hypothetical protein